MVINKISDSLIKKLTSNKKIERPVDVLKKLIENSIDAWAKNIEINVINGGLDLISVKDDWEGIQLSDIENIFKENYTSKIREELDIKNISTYGFKWISINDILDVSRFTITSKTAYSQIATKISIDLESYNMNHVPVSFEHGTLVSVENLFYNDLDQLESLKSSQTEFYYCYSYFMDIAICYWDISFSFKKNNQLIFELIWWESIEDRINKLYKKDRSNRLYTMKYNKDGIVIDWVVLDPSICFSSNENIFLSFNKKYFENKAIYESAFTAYNKFALAWKYPLLYINIDLDPSLYEIDIHDSKLILNVFNEENLCKAVYQTVYNCLNQNESENGFSVSSVAFDHKKRSSGQNVFLWSKDLHDRWLL